MKKNTRRLMAYLGGLGYLPRGHRARLNLAATYRAVRWSGGIHGSMPSLVMGSVYRSKREGEAMDRPPIIDLRARYRVIVDTPNGPRWQTIGKGVASRVSALRCSQLHGHNAVWIFDGLGGREYVTAGPLIR